MLPLILPCHTLLPIVSNETDSHKLMETLLALVFRQRRSRDAELQVHATVHALARSFVPVQTVSFHELVVDGSWHKIYSNLLQSPLPVLINHEIFDGHPLALSFHTEQEIDAAAHSCRDTIHWQLVAHTDPSHPSLTTPEVVYDGSLIMESKFVCISNKKLSMIPQEHYMLTESLSRPQFEKFTTFLHQIVPRDSFSGHNRTFNLLVSS
jgi:hypothetical protein